MKYPETPPSHLDTTVGLLPDEGGSLIPLQFDGVDLAQLPDGIELRESTLGELNTESRKLLIGQIAANIVAHKDQAEAYRGGMLLRRLSAIAGLGVYAAAGVGAYLLESQPIAAANNTQTYGAEVTFTTLGGAGLGTVLIMFGLANSDHFVRKMREHQAKETRLRKLLEFATKSPISTEETVH